MKSSSLIQDYGLLVEQRQSYAGRGLRENRINLYLLDHFNHLRIKQAALITRDYEVKLEYLIKMQQYLQNPPDYTEFMIFINLSGYVKSIPHHKGKINMILRKLAILEKFSTPPQYKPTPSNFEEQIIYPTSSVYKILQSIAEKAAEIQFVDVLKEFKELTTDHEELEMLLSHVFDMAWSFREFPFFNPSGKVFNFLHVKTSTFEPPYLDEKYQSLTINELSSSGWPYQPVVEILNSLFYIVNPIEGAKIFYEAMDKTANIVTISTEEEELVDFDTLFPLILISVLASGLVCEPNILQYISMLSTSNYPDSIVVFAASYVEAILAHLNSLDETGKPLSKPVEEEN